MTNSGAGVLLTGMLAVAIGIAAPADGAETSPHTGVWKADVAKSSPGIKSMVEMVVVDAENYNIDGAGEDMNGHFFQFKIQTKFDGKDYPISGISWADAAQAKRGDGQKLQLIEKKDGKVAGVITCEVSADRKTRTCTLDVTDGEGRSIHSQVVFERSQ
jgi:hypothetical protein